MLRSYGGMEAFNGQAPLSRKELIVSFYWIRSPEDEDLVSDSRKVKCVSTSKFPLEDGVSDGRREKDKSEIRRQFYRFFISFTST